MRGSIGRWINLIRIGLAAAIWVVGILATLSIPSPLVPAVEGGLFLGLLIWAQWEYENRRRDSPAYQQHLANVRAFASSARDQGLYRPDSSGHQWEAVQPVDMSTPRARDFIAHFPAVAQDLEEWNQVAHDYRPSIGRFYELVDTTSQAASGGDNPALRVLLIAIGEGHVEPAMVTWRVESGRLEASWQLDVDHQPAFAPIATSGSTIEDIVRVWELAWSFPDNPVARDRRGRLATQGRLRPQLMHSLERAEIAVDLKGKCVGCPR